MAHILCRWWCQDRVSDRKHSASSWAFVAVLLLYFTRKYITSRLTLHGFSLAHKHTHTHALTNARMRPDGVSALFSFLELPPCERAPQHCGQAANCRSRNCVATALRCGSMWYCFNVIRSRWGALSKFPCRLVYEFVQDDSALPGFRVYAAFGCRC